LYPEDPELARRYIRTSKLRDEQLLKEHLADLFTYGSDAVLARLFDEAYSEV
jgi:hypothetical protein